MSAPLSARASRYLGEVARHAIYLEKGVLDPLVFYETITPQVLDEVFI